MRDRRHVALLSAGHVLEGSHRGPTTGSRFLVTWSGAMIELGKLAFVGGRCVLDRQCPAPGTSRSSGTRSLPQVHVALRRVQIDLG
jgi:hypothetical protein